MFKVHRGFSLIELIMIIVIIGILSVTAGTRFFSLSRDAEQAVFDHKFAEFKLGVQNYYFKWLIARKPSQAFNGFISTPSEFGFPAGNDILNEAFESDCQKIWQDVMPHEAPVTLINAVNGWQSTLSSSPWARNATMNPHLGESEDLYCHFVYTNGFLSGAFSGQKGERLPVIQYHIKTGETDAFEWPYRP